MTEGQRRRYRKWYEKNGKKYNASRRKKYASDKVYRRRQRDYALLYRTKGPLNYNRVGEKRYRTLNGEQVRVFTLPEVSLLLGKHLRTLRTWESRGYFPAPSLNGKQRAYLMYQVDLIKLVGDMITMYRYNHVYRKEKLLQLAANIKQRWSGG